MDEQKCAHAASMGFSTTAIHAGQEPDRWKSRAVVPPVVTATTFKQDTPYGEQPEYVYGRSTNPTRSSLESCLAGVENARFARVFASGMAAISCVVSLLSAGDHLLTTEDIYGGTSRLFRSVIARIGIDITYVDFTNIDNIKGGLKQNTKMIWIESPTNPLMKVIDIEAVVKVARTQPNIIVVADNTFLTPYFQSPLDLGVDVTVYSISKYVNGHADVLMGSASTNDPKLAERITFLQNELPTHPALATTRKQTRGHSGVFSFRHRGGARHTAALFAALRLFTVAESLGGYESLIALPCTMSHRSLPEELKQRLGLTDNLIRLSIGLEDVNDLIADLEQAFNKAFSCPPAAKL